MKVVGYSTEHAFAPGSEQFAYLEEELLSPDRTDRKRTPWLVVVGHRPVYIDSNFSGWAAPKGKAASPTAAETPLNASDIASAATSASSSSPCF